MAANKTLNHCRSWLGCSLSLSVCAYTFWVQPAHAEGTKQIVAGGGARPLTEWRPQAFISGVPRRTLLQVYANAGEVINLGSSAVGVGAGNAVVFAPGVTVTPTTTPLLDCQASQPTTGRITSRAQELAGPLPAAGGYTPCVFTVTTPGIYQIAFYGPAGGNPAPDVQGTPTASIADATGNFNANQASGVAIWDITVRANAASTLDINGRVFSNYLALLTGGNGATRKVNSNLFVQTKDGYQYNVNTNNLDPNGFIFFSNNRGFTAAGQALYRSINIGGPPTFPLPAGVTFQQPDDPDTAQDFTNKLFFNSPNPAAISGLSSVLGYATSPQLPAAGTDFTFTGAENNTPNQAGTSPLGGNFRFNNPNSSAGSYTITIDVNNDGDYLDQIDRVIVGTAVPGSNTAFWDGRDGLGNPVPAATFTYNAQLSINAGEAHFPLLDAEGSGGLIITRTQPGSSPNPATVYYDDTDGNNNPLGTTGGPPNPIKLLVGGNSATGNVHQFGNNTGTGFGDQKGIDTWTYFPSVATGLIGGINIKAADLQITKTDNQTTVAAGAPITYTIEVFNDGPSDVTGVGVQDTVPAQITGVSWTCAIATGPTTGACGAASGTGNAIDTTVNLNSKARAIYTVTGTVSPTATGTLSNTATVVRPKDVTDPVNQDDQGGNTNINETATDTTTIAAAAAVAGTKSVALAADVDGTGSLTPGDRVRYTITYTNTGSAAATNFQIVDPLPAGLTIFGTPTVTPTGVGTNAAVNPAYNGAGTNTLLDIGAVLATNGTITVTVEATVGSGATGNLFNQATATSDAPGFPPSGVPTDATTPPGNIDQTPYPNNGATDPTGITVGAVPVPLANKSVRFVTDNDGTQTLTIGDDLQYTITVRNTTSSPINNLVISDAIPVQLRVLRNTINVSGGFTVASSLSNDFDGTGNPVALTNPGTLAAGATVTLTFNARLKPGSASPITNQGRVNYAGDGGNPVLTDASDSNNPTAPGTNNDPGDPGVGTGNNVSQPNSSPSDPTIINFVSPFEPNGTKSVRIFTDADNNGVLTTNDVVEYTVIYTNSDPSSVITNFLATDSLPSGLAFVPGSYSFTFSGTGTTVTGNPNYNGTSDTNLTNADPTGALGSGGGQVVIKFRATVTAAANTTIANQASATSVGGLSPSITDAVAGPSDLPQGLDDGTNQGNQGNTGDDDPTLLTVVATPAVSGTKAVAIATDADGTGSVTTGDRVRYTITYTNTGAGAANSFQINDVLPAGLTLAATPTVTPSGSGTVAAVNPSYNGTNAPTLLAAGAVLAPNGTITVTVDATVNSGVTGNLFNQAIASSPAPGFPPAGVPTDAITPPGSINQSPYGDTGPSDRTGLTIGLLPVPTLNKSVRFVSDNDNTTSLTIGDDIQYTIIVRNPTSSPINNLVISDVIPVQLLVLRNTITVEGLALAASLPGSDFNGTNNPVALTQPGTLPPGATITLRFNARLRPGAANPITNQARANYAGDNGTPLLSDASNSTNPTAPGSGDNPGNPGNIGSGGNVNQPNQGSADPTIINFVNPVSPSGSKSVRLFADTDGSGTITTGDVIEYTITYINTNPTDAVSNFLAIDSINPSQLRFVPGSYSFTTTGTTVTGNPSYNGTTDTNLTNPTTRGQLNAGGGRIAIAFRATITAGADVQISNQASATSTGGTVNNSLTDAVAGANDVPQLLDDGVNLGNLADPGDDEPTVLVLASPPSPRLRLIKRITNATRGGVPLGGINFGQFVDDPADSNDNAPGFSQLSPIGVSKLGEETPLTSGDEVDYTIYFLSDGTGSVNNVRFCDLIPSGTTFIPDSFGVGAGISLNRAGTTGSVTNSPDTDAGTFFSPLAPLPPGNACPSQNNPDGAVILNLGNVSNTSGNNFGFIRFRVKIN